MEPRLPNTPPEALPQGPASSLGRCRRFVYFSSAVAVIALVIGAYWLTQHSTKSKPATTQSAPPQLTGPKIGQVSITDSGFVPATILVQTGSIVTWTNSDTKPHQLVADPSSDNGSDTDFTFSKTMQAGYHYSFTFTKAGTYHYHDESSTGPPITSVVEVK